MRKFALPQFHVTLAVRSVLTKDSKLSPSFLNARFQVRASRITDEMQRFGPVSLADHCHTFVEGKLREIHPIAPKSERSERQWQGGMEVLVQSKMVT